MTPPNEADAKEVARRLLVEVRTANKDQWMTAAPSLIEKVCARLLELEAELELAKTKISKMYGFEMARERDALKAEVLEFEISNDLLASQLSQTQEDLKVAKVLIERVSNLGPDHTKKGETACWFCDMGGAGYSSKGDGFHDDICVVKDAQTILRPAQQREGDEE